MACVYMGVYMGVMACIYGSNGMYIWGLMACIYGSNGMYIWE